MIKFRLIARLDIRNERLIKTICCEGVRVVGDPAEYARRYDAAGIDEIIYLDVVASLYGRNGLARLLDKTTSDVFTPITAGGGVRTVDDGMALLRAGADKIAVNTAAIRRPALITELAEKFGSQAVVVQIDAKRKGNGWEAYCEGARQATGRRVSDWCVEVAERGAGELFVTAIDREGVGTGFDTALASHVARANIPVVIAGGFNEPKHAIEAAQAGVSGIAIAGALHYSRVSLRDIRQALSAAGVPVRFAA